MAEDTTLAPCPNCGTGTIVQVVRTKTFYFVGTCWKCRMKGPEGRDTAEARALWNGVAEKVQESDDIAIATPEGILRVVEKNDCHECKKEFDVLPAFRLCPDCLSKTDRNRALTERVRELIGQQRLCLVDVRDFRGGVGFDVNRTRVVIDEFELMENRTPGLLSHSEDNPKPI